MPDTNENYIRRYVSLSAAIDILCRRQLPLLDPQSWDDRNDRHYMRLYRDHRKAASIYAACFTQAPETYHHWSVFGGSDGACIQFRREDFERHIKSYPVRAGTMDYLFLDEADELTPADVERLPFLKRKAFVDEVEFRVMALRKEPQVPVAALPIPLSLIRKVVISPWSPPPVCESVVSLIEGLDGCGHIAIERSHLIDNRRWKRAGDTVVGKSSQRAPDKIVLKPEVRKKKKTGTARATFRK